MSQGPVKLIVSHGLLIAMRIIELLGKNYTFTYNVF
jgi:hypothetical protein